MKLLVTNFPCMPENNTIPETIIDYQNKERSDTFCREEITALSRWINKHGDYLFTDDFKRGSVFFIRLGEGKQSHLEEDNLEEGVEFLDDNS